MQVVRFRTTQPEGDDQDIGSTVAWDDLNSYIRVIIFRLRVLLTPIR